MRRAWYTPKRAFTPWAGVGCKVNTSTCTDLPEESNWRYHVRIALELARYSPARSNHGCHPLSASPARSKSVSPRRRHWNRIIQRARGLQCLCCCGALERVYKNRDGARARCCEQIPGAAAYVCSPRVKGWWRGGTGVPGVALEENGIE